jgi:hypothetical protein
VSFLGASAFTRKYKCSGPSPYFNKVFQYSSALNSDPRVPRRHPERKKFLKFSCFEELEAFYGRLEAFPFILKAAMEKKKFSVICFYFAIFSQ